MECYICSLHQRLRKQWLNFLSFELVSNYREIRKRPTSKHVIYIGCYNATVSERSSYNFIQFLLLYSFPIVVYQSVYHDEWLNLRKDMFRERDRPSFCFMYCKKEIVEI